MSSAAVERRPMSFEEYLALPQGVRAEYVDGVAIMTPPGELHHQVVEGRLVVMLASALPGLRVLPEAGVRTAQGRRRVPDVVVLAASEEGVFAEQVPVVVVEVLSASTRTEDTLRKTSEYAAAGIGQYWLVDREQRLVTVLANNGDGWDVRLELAAGHAVGSVEVGEHGTVRIDLEALLAP